MEGSPSIPRFVPDEHGAAGGWYTGDHGEPRPCPSVHHVHSEHCGPGAYGYAACPQEGPVGSPPPPPSPGASNSARPVSLSALPSWVLADKAWMDEGAPLDVVYLSDGVEILRHDLTLGEDVMPAERRLDMPHPTMRIVRRR